MLLFMKLLSFGVTGAGVRTAALVVFSVPGVGVLSRSDAVCSLGPTIMPEELGGSYGMVQL